MKIAVIAANGRSGQIFVTKALDAGHEIRAGVFGVHSLPSHPNLQILNCDATNLTDVTKLIAGTEAVVSLIGHTKNAPKDVQMRAVNNAVLALAGSSVRFVSLTGTGVRFLGDKPSMIDRLMNLSIKIIDPDRVNDGIAHAESLKKSGLNWTIVRVLKLTNGGLQKYSLSSSGPARLFTSRLTVADAILQVLKTNEFVKQAPVLSR